MRNSLLASFAALWSLVLAFGCAADGGSPGPTSPPSRIGSIRMMPTPGPTLRACRSVALLRAACPEEIPSVPGVRGRAIKLECKCQTFGLSYGGPYKDPRQNHPPG